MTIRSRPLLCLGIVLVLTALACDFLLPAGGLPGLEQATTTQTRTATPSQTQLPATPTATVEPSPTATPTITLTPTLELPRAQLIESTNCRTGPQSVYDLISTFLTGKTLDILGRNADQTYWFVSDPLEPGTECWLWGRYAQVSGPVDTVPVFTPPPTPTPSFVWGGSWSVLLQDVSGTMSLSQSGSSISGTLTLGSNTYDIEAAASEAGRQADGEVLQNGNALVSFTWYMLNNTDQFRGSYEQGSNTHPWCGYRSGGGYPSPCVWP